MTRSFVIRPFGKKQDSSGQEIDFERIHKLLFAPALKETTDGGGTTGEVIDAGNIREDIFSLIVTADLVLCDISIHNANVFYELGIRHALRSKGTLLLKGEPSDGTPFDLLTDRYLNYDVNNPSAIKDKLVHAIRSTMGSWRKTDSPVFQMLSNLPELNPELVQVIPLGFAEKVGEARSIRDVKRLGRLAGEVTGQRFERGGLRLVARAQSWIDDYDGAQKSWETLREKSPGDGEANIELARIYEQLYRILDQEDLTLLEKSKQAIRRVLEGNVNTNGVRANALQILARIHKTLWWKGFKDIENMDVRRSQAANRTLRAAHEAYLDAFFENLDVYYAGIGALELGTIMLELFKTAGWRDAFNNDDEANEYKKTLQRKIYDLRGAVSLSIEKAVSRYGSQWAKLDRAYLLFLTREPSRRVRRAHEDSYQNIIDGGARRRQLEVFISLGINSEVAKEIISILPVKHTAVHMQRRLDQR